MTMTSIKREARKYIILALAIIILQGYVAGFISKYLTFLSGLGSFQAYIISFLSILIILIPADMILQRTI